MFDELDMQNYKPFKKFSYRLNTRDIKEKKVTWPYFKMERPEFGLMGRLLEKKDIPIIAEMWRKNYCELYGSSNMYSWVLYPNKYEENVAFAETWEKDRNEKEFCMFIAEDIKNSKITSCFCLKKDDLNLHIELSLGMVAPEYRSGKKGFNIVILADDFLRLIEKEAGAEYITCFCETWQKMSQSIALKHWGMKIAGIFPGQYTRYNGDNQEYRGCTVHFYKFINEAEKFVSKPEEFKLIPETKEVWDLLENLNKVSRDNIKLKN